MREARVNLNSLIFTAGFGILTTLLTWEGNRLTAKVESAHDDIIKIESTMVPRQEFDLEMNSIRVRLAAVEFDIANMKHVKSN